MNLFEILVTTQMIYGLPMLVVAVLIDLTLGDPPNALHPVAWLGKLISGLEKIGLALGRTGQFVSGIIMTLLCIGIFAGGILFIFFLLFTLIDEIDILYIFAYPVFGGLVLKMTFTVSGLRYAATQIRKLLEMDAVEQTRRELRALVSRNTADLSKPLIVSSAVESVAEGLCDSVVAPLFYFLVLGLPGALMYRAVNTLDSMIGYRGRYEYLGKFAARLDDVLNFIPARIAALLLLFAASLKGKGANTRRVMNRFHGKTSSPNAGWPMSAMAGALEVKLQKPDHYVLGDGKKKLVPDTIRQALTFFTIAASCWLVICGIGGGIYLAIAA